MPCGQVPGRTKGFGWEIQSFFCLATGCHSSTHLTFYMNHADTMNCILHRSSSTIIKTAVLIVSPLVGSDKYASAQNHRAWSTFHCFVGQVFESKTPVRVPKEKFLLWCTQLWRITFPSTSSWTVGENSQQYLDQAQLNFRTGVYDIPAPVRWLEAKLIWLGVSVRSVREFEIFPPLLSGSWSFAISRPLYLFWVDGTAI